MQDYEMIKRIRQGDRALFGQLAEKYYSEVFRYCYYQTGNEQAAADCTQETFYHLMRFLDSYTERNRFKAYLLRIALNVCRDYFRKNGRQEISYEEFAGDSVSAGSPFHRIHRNSRRHLEEHETDGFANLSCPSPEVSVETRLLIQEALNVLPQFQREVIIFFYYYGYRQREIAQITGVPISTVKTRLRAGTGKLQEFFRQSGLL